jgi:hypothetical protein
VVVLFVGILLVLILVDKNMNKDMFRVPKDDYDDVFFRTKLIHPMNDRNFEGKFGCFFILWFVFVAAIISSTLGFLGWVIYRLLEYFAVI